MPTKSRKRQNKHAVAKKKQKTHDEGNLKVVSTSNITTDSNTEEAVVEDEETNSFQKLMASFDQTHKKLISKLLSVDTKLNIEEQQKENPNTLKNDESDESEDEEESDTADDEMVDDENDSEADVSDEEIINHEDSFKIHFDKTIDEEVMDKIMKTKLTVSEKQNPTSLEEVHIYSYPKDIMESLQSHVPTSLQDDADKIFNKNIKSCIKNHWTEINVHKKKQSSLTGVQQHLFPYIFSYQDFYYANRNFKNGEEIRKLYCLHAVNHVLKSNSRVLKNNKRLHLTQNTDDRDIDDCRDQGLTRPKVLIMVPFKDACYKCVNNIIKTLLKGTKGQVMNKKRFQEEFGPNEDVQNPKDKPDDFKQMFEGNIDDCFRIGLTVSKKNIKLYSHFYSSDVIIASPLGLRTIIGTESEVQDFDFLSSIEVLILDQTDVFLMQNWEHVLHIMEHMNKLPKKSHDTDFSRVRMWAINNWREYYRQTLIFSSLQTPEINGIFNKFSHNFSGKVKRFISKQIGYVRQIATPLKQVFYKFDCSTHEEAADARFQYFVDRILPMYRSGTSSNVGIFVPSYFDFVRLRNYFKREEISFVQISEYSQRANISRARNLFLEKRKTFIIFTERFYFFYRYKIRGIRTMIFYQLPQYPQFYSELVNFMETRDKFVSDSSVSCIVLFSPYDGSRLEGVVGTDRCRRMLAADKKSFMLLTET